MPDFNLPGRRPADAASAEAQVQFLAAEDAYELLTEVHLDHDGGAEDFLLFADVSGYSAVAAHLHYGEDGKTFTLATETLPTFALAAAWLVQRGAETDPFLDRSGHPGAPADARSASAAARLLESGSRYRLVDHGAEPGETWAMLRDGSAAGAERPFLLHLETVDPDRGYKLREGSFASPQEAQQWLENRRTPLPPVADGNVSVVVSPQANAARTRTATGQRHTAAAEPAPALAAAAATSARRSVR
ncbi:hypothetical protein [Kitasatospora sp. A2-31]|uniref:hypothetical protein n=1 Tax=Kitasatospora sp. A2-31 TaxID=2916414 RepID=UPI001EECAB87|nr:hypothetical protein [Kitasatospora sp. A2-31]MCG6497069.1 hypothetical protein [Kitasatospora sp. A2-31]